MGTSHKSLIHLFPHNVFIYRTGHAKFKISNITISKNSRFESTILRGGWSNILHFNCIDNSYESNAPLITTFKIVENPPPSFEHQSAVSEAEPHLSQPDPGSACEHGRSSVHHQSRTVDQQGPEDDDPEQGWTSSSNHLKYLDC